MSRLNTGSDIVVDDPGQLRLHALAPERVEEDVGEGLRVRRGGRGVERAAERDGAHRGAARVRG